MQKVGQVERKTQDRVIKLFKDDLGYRYLGNLMEQENENIIPDLLKSFLRGQRDENGNIKYSEYVINNAIEELQKMNFKSVPNLEIDGKIYNYLDSIRYLNKMK